MKPTVFFNKLMAAIILTGFGIHSIFLSPCHAKSVKTSYKKYSIFKYRNSDILCEPYTVNKDDWLYKIFRKKGEISEKDFPRFITIFKKINPQISNVDAIEPGIHIVIPLKEVKKEEYEQTAPGSVEIPVIEFSALSKNFDLTPYLQKHDVQKGETISEIVDKEFLKKGGGLSKEGLKAFELANPDIQNINIIHEGAQVNLPDPSIKSQPWFQSLLTGRRPGIPQQKNGTAAPKTTKSSTIQTRIQEHELAQLRKYSALIGGTLLSKGKMYFPGKDGAGQVLDLSLAPMIETQDGRKILIISGQNVNSQLLESVQSYWKGIKTQLISETTDEIKKRVKKGVETVQIFIAL